MPWLPARWRRRPHRRADRRYCACLVVIKDELCLLEICRRLRSEGVDDFRFCIPAAHWDGRPTPAGDRDAVVAVARQLEADGARVAARVFPADEWRPGCTTPCDAEARLRNRTIAWAAHGGAEHFLIVDGDELWLPGTLDQIDALVERGRTAVSSAMIPVVGLPGYPIDGARDRAVVYVGRGVRFTACRSIDVATEAIAQRGVVHFTACRRSMDEIIAKHRGSGHYGDPDYDFEGWIADTLPRIRPGLRDVHMYRPHQIWPMVREWRAEELAQIPPAFHPYLGIPAGDRP